MDVERRGTTSEVRSQKPDVMRALLPAGDQPHRMRKDKVPRDSARGPAHDNPRPTPEAKAGDLETMRR